MKKNEGLNLTCSTTCVVCGEVKRVCCDNAMYCSDGPHEDCKGHEEARCFDCCKHEATFQQF